MIIDHRFGGKNMVDFYRHPAFKTFVFAAYLAGIVNVAVEPNWFYLFMGCFLGAYIGIYYTDDVNETMEILVKIFGCGRK